MREKWAEQKAFTIVELLIVIVVIAILAAITVVAYTGIQARASDASIQTALRNAVSKIEAYKAVNGQYPATQSVQIAEGDATGQVLYVDANCYIGSGNTVKTAAWIPDIEMTLPQSDSATRARGQRGCFVYQSDGQRYVLAAWNAIHTGPQSATFYRRMGWRALNNNTQYYLCNNTNVGGIASGSYIASDDYYKYSYVLSNITDCNETPPPGA